MAYSIVKHRRGTSDAWLTLNLVPAEGELVIEECPDGIRKCKIGDGKTNFKDLPYVAEDVRRALRNYIDTVKQELGSDISTVEQQTKESLDKVGNALTSISSLNSTVTNLEVKLDESVAGAIEDSKKYADKAAEDAASIAIKNATDKIDDLAKTTGEMSKQFDDKLVFAGKAANAYSDKKAQELTTAYTDAIKTKADELKTQIDKVDSSVQDAIANITPTLEAHKETVNSEVAGQLTTFEQEITSSVNDAMAEHETTVNTVATDLSALREDVNSRFLSATEASVMALANLEMTLQNELAQADEATLDSAKKYADDQIGQVSDKANTLDTTVQGHTNKINDIQLVLDGLSKTYVDLVTVNALIDELAVAPQNLLKDDVDKLSESLRAAELTIIELTNADSTLQKSFTNLLDPIKLRLDRHRGDIDSNANTNAQQHDDINKAIAKIEREYKAADTDLRSNLTNEKTTIYAQLSALVDQDTLLLTTINGINSALNATISDEVAKINNVLHQQQNTLAVLENSISFYHSASLFQVNLAEERAKKREQEIANTVSEVSNRIDSLALDIEKANTAIAVQGSRLSSIASLPYGSTKGDAELIQLRTDYLGNKHESAVDAVHQIGKDLLDLQERLPEFIPDSAIDGLFYEDNVLYLTSQGKYLTDDGEPLYEPVTITGGAGGGSLTVVKLTNLGDTNRTISKGSEVRLTFTYTSTEEGVPTTGDGTVNISINNKRVSELTDTVVHGVPYQTDDLAKYLKEGTNTIKITCNDQLGGTRSAIYTVTVVSLRIESTFNPSQIFAGQIVFRYTVHGSVQKTTHILLDGVEIETASLNAAVTGRESTYTIAKQRHGSHILEAYVTATIGDKEVPSNVLKYEILCLETSNDAAMLASVFESPKVVQGDLINIPYMIYDPRSADCNVKLSIYSDVDGVITLYDSVNVVVDRAQQVWSTRKYPAPKSIFEIEYNYNLYGEPKTLLRRHELEVTPVHVDVDAETDGVQLVLSSAGRLNTDSNRDKWTFTPKATSANPTPATVTTEFKNFNWASNGWITDDAGDTCLRLTGDARAIINFRIFAEDFKAYGKTIEFEYAVRDVHSRATTVIECNKAYNALTGECVVNNAYGFYATPDTAVFSSDGTQVSCNYKDDERIRVSITVEADSTDSRFVSIYLDGVLSGIQHYESDMFQQNNAVPILLGSNDCCLDLYSIRVYNKALSHSQILDNFIADKADPNVKQQLVTENAILDSVTKKISYDEVKKLGNIPIITFTGAMPTYKGDKKKASEGNGVHFLFEDPARSSEPLINCVLKEIDVQGTSSQFYVRKNWKIKFDDKIEHMPGAIKEKTYCIKVDYAEATGTHNTGCANYVETLYDRLKVTLPPQKDDSRVRTTIQGFPCVIFEKATETSEPVFASKGNFNYDKGAEKAFGFSQEYYDAFGVECWEFCNNTSDACNLVGPIKPDWSDDFEPRYVPDSYNFDKIEDLLELKEAAAKDPPEGTITPHQLELLSTLQASCIKNFKDMHDWVVSTAPYKLVGGVRVPITQQPLPKPVTYEGTTYTADDKDFRLAKFKAEFKKYFNMHYASIYYVFTFFALMTDQRAKNMFLTRWAKPVVQNEATGTWWVGDEDSGISIESAAPTMLMSDDGKQYYNINGETTPAHYWFPYFYDNDTIFGINNEGALVFDYFHEDIDQIETSNIDENGNVVKSTANVYNGQNSILWNNFRECFPAEISNTYKTLRKSGSEKLSYNSLVDCFITNGSDKWSAMIYNEDAEYKYVSMARYKHEHEENGKKVYGIDASNLYQVRGTGEQHLRYFLANRLKYCDSKWYAGTYPNDIVFMRIYTPAPVPQETIDAMTDPVEKAAAQASNDRINASLAAVPADPSITVTPFSDMYTGVKYKANGTLQQKRTKAGTAYKFSPPHALDEEDPTQPDNPNDTGTSDGIVIPDGSESAADETYGDTETAVYGASELSSLGNLAGLYCGVINVSNASKLTELIIGSAEPGYHNDNFRELHVGTNRLLKKIDVRNCSGLGIYGKSPQKTLALSDCPNIEEIYTEGTNLAAVSLPTSGYIKVLHLPSSISTIDIRNQQHLTMSGFSVANNNYSNVKKLRIENCTNLDTNAILAACCADPDTGRYSVERVRLTGVSWNLPDTSFLQSLFPRYDEYGNVNGGIRGIDENDRPTEDAYLKGTCHISSQEIKNEANEVIGHTTLSGDEYALVKSHYPDLNITFDRMTSKLTFMCPTVGEDGSVSYTAHDFEISSTDSVLPSFGGSLAAPAVAWPENAAFTYRHIGWSRREQPYLGINDTQDLYVDKAQLLPDYYSDGQPHNYLREEYYQADALLRIEGARVLYPVFAATRKLYNVSFYNRTAPEGQQHLLTLAVPYGHDAVYPNALPTKQDTSIPNQYPFAYWDPKPENVIEDMSCDACFNFETADYMIVPLGDISEYVDYFGVVNLGYVLNEQSKTMSISNCKNKVNNAYLVPEFYWIPNETGIRYQVTAIGGFSSCHKMERFFMPSSTTVLMSNALYNCSALTELDLHEGLITIGGSALQGCTSLTKLTLPSTLSSIGDAAFANCPNLYEIDTTNNDYFTVEQGCLMSTQFGKIIQGGLEGISKIPEDVEVKALGAYSYAGTNIASAVIPNGITTIPSNAFSRCAQLDHVVLPNTITLLDATCFAWCKQLKQIVLPESLININTYVFNGCGFETVEIPAATTSLLERSFGELPNLRHVKFNKLERDGELVVPDIKPDAFAESGSNVQQLIFEIPWPKDRAVGFPWGAKNAVLMTTEEVEALKETTDV